MACMAHLNLRQSSYFNVKVLGLPQLMLLKHACACREGILHLS